MTEISVCDEVEIEQHDEDDPNEQGEWDNFMEAIMSQIRPAVAYWNTHYAEMFNDVNEDDYSGMSEEEILSCLPFGTHTNPIPYNESHPLFRGPEPVPLMTRIKLLFGSFKGFTQTGFFLAILLCLFAVPTLYIYFGAVYLEQCDYINYYPIMFLFMGLSSYFMITSSIIRLILVKYLDKEWFSVLWVNSFPLLQFSILGIYQAVSLFSYDINPPPGHPTCPSFYYDLVWWNEWLAPSIALFFAWNR